MKNNSIGAENDSTDAKRCGLIMPISMIDGCTPDHWVEVKTILEEAITGIEKPVITVNLVSDADEVGVIQKRIVQNVYSADIVVCDVSAKNPNVMFELGMRLAFDRPTVIIKDDKTDYSFDTGIIEHLPYPRDLRFAKIVEFKELLKMKVVATLSAAVNDPTHSTFLKNFGEFKTAKLNEAEVTPDRLILDMLTDLKNDVSRLRTSAAQTHQQIQLPAMGGPERFAEATIQEYCAANKIADAVSLFDDQEFRQWFSQVTAGKVPSQPTYLTRQLFNYVNRHGL